MGTLLKMNSCNQHIIFLIDGYKKLTRAIPVIAVTSTSATTIFVDKWVMLYSIYTYLLTKNGLQFVMKFFSALTARLGIKHLTTAAYHPQTNGQVETFSQTIVARL